jgi:hypothetical protein
MQLSRCRLSPIALLAVLAPASACFDQKTGKITRVVATQRTKSGDRELYAEAILANDVGLIDNEDRHGAAGTDDVFDVMAPVTGGKLTSKWTKSS